MRIKYYYAACMMCVDVIIRPIANTKSRYGSSDPR
jgi:hypothetical protein